MATATTKETRTVEREYDPGELLDKAIEATVLNVDRVATSYSTAIDGAETHVRRALLKASAIARLRSMLDKEVMTKLVIPLMNSPLGFMTDKGTARSKDKTPYSVEEVREAVVEAMIAGFHLDGNEFNIIGGRMYGAQAGYWRKLTEVPGITDIKVAPGIPTLHNGMMVCRVALSWRLNGKPDELRGTDGKPGLAFPLISYQGSTADNLIGKAKRKAFKAAFEQATGSVRTEPDGEVGDPMEGVVRQSRAEQVENKLTSANGKTPAHVAALDDLRGRCASLPSDEVEVLALKASGRRTADVLALDESEVGAMLKELTGSE